MAIKPSQDPFADQYFDVLQNIEMVIVKNYREQAELTDHNVNKVFEGLERAYKAESAQRTPPALKLTPQEQGLYDQVKVVSEWRMGRGEMTSTSEGTQQMVEPIRMDEMIACLKRLQRSVKLWTTDYGIRGYLNYVSSFFP